MLGAMGRKLGRGMLGLAVSLLGVDLAVVPAGAQSKDAWDAVVAAARTEGKVVVYSGYISPDTHDAIAKAFDKKYGIKIDYLTARGTELRERIRTEQASGRFLGDVLHNAQTLLELSHASDTPLQPHGGIPGAAHVKAQFKPRVTDHWVPIFTINYGFLINSNLVKPGEEPNSWADLLEPKWRGKILSDETRAAGGGRVMFHMTYDKFGATFHDKLAAQKLVFARDYRESTRRVARGEYPIYIPLILSDIVNLKGLPVRYVIPSEGVSYGSYGAAMLRSAPRPNAARLLVDFYLSDEAQTIYAKSAHGYVVESISEKLTPEVEALANVKPLVAEDFTTIQERLDQAKAIYK